MSFSLNRTNLTVIGFLIIGGYFLWTEHSAHLALALPFLPWLFLLACPLLHFFMHRGHGHGGHDEHKKTSTPDQASVSSETAPDTTRVPHVGGGHD